MQAPAIYTTYIMTVPLTQWVKFVMNFIIYSVFDDWKCHSIDYWSLSADWTTESSIYPNICYVDLVLFILINLSTLQIFKPPSVLDKIFGLCYMRFFFFWKSFSTELDTLNNKLVYQKMSRKIPTLHFRIAQRKEIRVQNNFI